MSPRELPIIFTAESVRAILACAKTQTRRVMNPKPQRLIAIGEHDRPGERPRLYGVDSSNQGVEIRIPYVVGDVLWVKEAWGLHCYLDDTYWYHGNIDGWSRDDVLASWSPAYRADWGPNQEGCFWRSPLYMPRWASRIAREVTDVRAQRVQAISEEDAVAEGYAGSEVETPREQFAAAWDRINRKDGKKWKDNPWAFAISFRVMESA